MNIIDNLNNSKYFYAILMILLNMGAKYIEIDLVTNHKSFLSSKIIRRLLIFTMAFIATKDIIASLVITACFIIIVLNLFNTNSKYCIIHKNIKDIDDNNDGIISAEEIEKAYNILKKTGKLS